MASIAPQGQRRSQRSLRPCGILYGHTLLQKLYPIQEEAASLARDDKLL